MTTSSTETAPAPRRTKAVDAEIAASAPPPAAVLLSLDDYLSREPRLVNRPEMMGAFARHCHRLKKMRATAEAYATTLTAFERGAS